MPGSWPPQDLPNLTDNNCTITSPATTLYNCIAWAAGDDSIWWEPDPQDQYYWPPNIHRAYTAAAFLQAYSSLGYKLCFDGALEEGTEKVALYGKGTAGAETPTHAALQLPDGKWTSKLGNCEDVTHTLADDVNGPCYGQVLCFLARPRP